MKTEKDISEQQALARMASFCSKAEHSTGEVERKLELLGIAPDAKGRILQYLADNKYVDDLRFARMFVHDKLKFNKWGRRKIAEALWMKRVPSDIQEEALAEISDDEYAEALLPLLKAKAHTIKAGSDYEWAAKLIKFAMQRGFDTTVIRRCVDEIVAGIDTDGYE